MSCVPVRGCRIGKGRPKVILPIVERTEAAILEKAAAFSTLCADCVEWRVDLFDAATDPGAVVRCLAKLRVLLKEKLLLVTLRTKEEGGSIPVSHEGYLRFLHTILDTDCADLIDIEFFTAGTDLPALVQDAHTAGVKVVCSSHDFHKTPPKAEMVSRMVAMQQAGADLPKLAVMPQSRADVLELLAATAEMTDHHPRNARHYHEHERTGSREPPVRRSLCLCHDLCQSRHGQRPRSGGAGCGQRCVGQPAAQLIYQYTAPPESDLPSGGAFCFILFPFPARSSESRSTGSRIRPQRKRASQTRPHPDSAFPMRPQPPPQFL